MSDPEKPPVEELFSDDDPGMDLGGEPPPEPSRRGGSLKPIIAGVAVVLLGLLWYVSSVHHSRFYLEVDDNRVTVTRGLYLPFGTAKFTPTPAYESFTIPPGIAPEMSGAMSHEELDRELRSLFVRVARKEIEDLERGDPERAETMIRKAFKLRYTTALEDRELQDMGGDVSFRRGLQEVRGIQERFDEAVREFRMAARRGSLRFKNADQWARVIAAQRDQIRQLARASGLDPDKVLSRTKNDFKGLLPPMPSEPAPEPGADAPDAGPE